MNEIPKISDSEWEIMKCIWANYPITTNEIIDQLFERTQWKPTTVKTMLSRLVKKQVIDYKKVNRTFEYFPLVAEEECMRAESKSFLSKVYSGALNTMLASFIEEEELSDEDIDELKRMLDKKKK